MIIPLHLLRSWRQARDIWRITSGSDSCRSETVTLWYPRQNWYRENAAEMLRIAHDAAIRLRNELGLPLPPDLACYVTNPDLAIAIQGTTGAAYEHAALVGVPERQLSVFAGTVAHEIAHIISRRVGDSLPRFKAEGFACYAASCIGAQTMPCGIPLHYHLVWMLSVGIRVSLQELWQRTDYSPELYDLAWSFATFAAERFGRRRYFDFYSSTVTRKGVEAPRMSSRSVT